MTLTFTWTLAIGGVDISPIFLATGTIDYGIATRDQSYSAPRAVFDIHNPASWPQYEGVWPTIAEGDEVLIHVTWDGTEQHRRFTGVVQAIEPTKASTRITATGRTVDYAQIPTGATNAFVPMTTESDSARLARLADGAVPPLTIEGAPGRWVRQIPTGMPASPLLDQVLRLAADCQALLLEDRLGVARYRTRNFTKPGRFTLPPDGVEADTLAPVIDRGTIVNSVAVYYGEPRVSTGAQRYVYAADNDSIAAIGERRVELTTDLQWGTGAAGLAAQYLAEHARGWTIPDVTILMWNMTGEEVDDVLDLQEGWPVRVTPLPVFCPFETYDGDVLGMTEIIHSVDYRVILHLAPSIPAPEEPDESPIYPDGIITGPGITSTGTTEDDDGRVYRWVKLDDPGTSWLHIDHDDPVLTEVCGRAGAGAGGDASGLYGSGGGGAAGGFLHQWMLLNPGDWPVDIGRGGRTKATSPTGSSESGEDTAFFSIRLYGGGRGGDATGDQDGGDGGSGGGTAHDRSFGTYYGIPGRGIPGMGHDGGAYGGGAGDDGAGIEVTIAGTTEIYCAGGPPGHISGGIPPTACGSGGPGAWLAAAARDGAAGGLTIQYRIA